MMDILFFLIFGWILTYFGLDEFVLQLLKMMFDMDFPTFVYYIFCGFCGFLNWLFYRLQLIMGRD